MLLPCLSIYLYAPNGGGKFVASLAPPLHLAFGSRALSNVSFSPSKWQGVASGIETSAIQTCLDRDVSRASCNTQVSRASCTCLSRRVSLMLYLPRCMLCLAPPMRIACYFIKACVYVQQVLHIKLRVLQNICSCVFTRSTIPSPTHPHRHTHVDTHRHTHRNLGEGRHCKRSSAAANPHIYTHTHARARATQGGTTQGGMCAGARAKWRQSEGETAQAEKHTDDQR